MASGIDSPELDVRSFKNVGRLIFSFDKLEVDASGRSLGGMEYVLLGTISQLTRSARLAKHTSKGPMLAVNRLDRPKSFKGTANPKIFPVFLVEIAAAPGCFHVHTF
jgi:hypothetical protein